MKITILKEYIKELFGTDINLDTADSNKELDYGPGHLIFFEAQMLTLPLRASENVYYHSTSVLSLIEYFDQLDNFLNSGDKTKKIRGWLEQLDFKGKDFLYFNGSNTLEIEDYTNGNKIPLPDDSIVNLLTNLCKIDINKLSIFDKNVFTNICSDSIPVIARNQIKNDGTSGNLFYEEVLPRKTCLFMVIGYDKYLLNDKQELNKESARAFNEKIKDTNTIFQFGANYSVGYGFSRLSQITI